MESMTPSSEMPKTIGLGQIGKLQELLGARLRKSTLLRDQAQEVIEDPAQVAAWLDDCEASFRKRVEARSNMIVRHFRVDRKLSPQKMLDATGRKQYTDKTVVDNMPKGEGDEGDMYFFFLGRSASDAELEKEYALRGLTPDPMAQARVNTDNPAFADEHPNGCHWQANGNWCFETFDRWGDGGRFVRVGRDRSGWDDRWWVGGIHK